MAGGSSGPCNLLAELTSPTTEQPLRLPPERYLRSQNLPTGLSRGLEPNSKKDSPTDILHERVYRVCLFGC